MPSDRESPGATADQPFIDRAISYADQGIHDRAIADFTEAIRVNPNSVVAFRRRGLSHAAVQKWHDAVADYTEAIRLLPDGPEKAAVHCERAKVSAERQEFDRAVADLTSALRLDPDPAFQARCFAERAKVRAKKDDWRATADDYTEAIRLLPDNAEWITGRLAAYTKLGDWRAATADATDLLRLSPSLRGTLLLARGGLHRQAGDFDAARQDLMEATALAATKGDAARATEIVRAATSLGNALGICSPDGRPVPALVNSTGGPVSPSAVVDVMTSLTKFSASMTLGGAGHPEAPVRRKMLVLWLLHGRLSRGKAAEVAGLGRATVQRSVAADRAGGWDGLRP